jgi:tetratricopeptide (TPR) repeat protein
MILQVTFPILKFNLLKSPLMNPEEKGSENPKEEEKKEDKNPTPEKQESKPDGQRPKMKFMDKLMNPSLLFSKNSDNPLINEGQVFLKKGRFDEALEAFEYALKEDKRSIDAQIGMGRALSSMGGIKNAKKGIAYFHNALKLDATRLDIYKDTINLYERLGDKKNAAVERKKQFIARTLKNNPNDSKANNNLGVIQLKQKNAGGAITSFKKSLKYSPGFLLAKINLANAYLQKADMVKVEEDKEMLIKQSLQLINQVMEKEQTAEGFLLKSKILMAKGEFKQALQYCDQAISSDPAMKEAYNTKRVLEERLGNIGKASQAYENFQSMNRQEQKEVKEKFDSPFE